jgi:hypothetical protein
VIFVTVNLTAEEAEQATSLLSLYAERWNDKRIAAIVEKIDTALLGEEENALAEHVKKMH